MLKCMQISSVISTELNYDMLQYLTVLKYYYRKCIMNIHFVSLLHQSTICINIQNYIRS